MKQKYHTVGTIPKSNRKIVETEIKSTPLIPINMAALFPGLVKTHQ